MAGQTVQPDQWIVADDGIDPAPLTQEQMHITRRRVHSGGKSLAGNILAAIPHIKGDVVMIVEDDDYYRPNHIETQLRHLEKSAAAGGTMLNYYNIQSRGWRQIRNSCSALCNTAFRAELLPALARACERVMAADDCFYHIDRLFWQEAGNDGLHDDVTVIGMKGLPGQAGIGVGHKASGWTPDRGFAQLRRWVGTDSHHYEVLMK